MRCTLIATNEKKQTSTGEKTDIFFWSHVLLFRKFDRIQSWLSLMVSTPNPHSLPAGKILKFATENNNEISTKKYHTVLVSCNTAELGSKSC